MFTFVRILETRMTGNKEDARRKVRDRLTAYLSQISLRKTPERYAILDAVYDMDGHFTLEELSAKLVENNFRVSRATLYNTVKLFLELRLIVRHNFTSTTRYEACYTDDNHLHQVCTVCGQVMEIDDPSIIEAIAKTRLKRFHRDGFALYIYGVCSACQRKLSIQRNTKKQQTTDKQ